LAIVPCQSSPPTMSIDFTMRVTMKRARFAVEAAEFVALVGPSGSGKSTLLSCLAGLDVPDGGQVLLNNERVARLPEADRARRRRAYIGLLMQSRNLLPGLTTEENVQLPMILAGRPYRDRAASLLDQVGMAPRRCALPSELSGGEAARVGLAVALALAPSVILADEPTAEVDAATEQDLIRLLGDHCAAGGTAFVATHSEALARTASRVIRLQDGRIVDDAADRQG
jgi:putative ABC transport system ATP-binding protein